MATDSPFRSPLSYLENPSPSPPRPSVEEVFAWSVRTDPPPPETSAREVREGEGGSRTVAAILRRNGALTAVRTASIAVRVSAAVLCLISFSVMAADKNRGWTLDAFDRYNEYR